MRDSAGPAKPPLEPSRPQEPIEFRFFTEIAIIEQLVRRRCERALPGRMLMAHFSVLNHFARVGGDCSLVHLSRTFQVTKAAMTNTIQRLAAWGYVRVVPDPVDRRAKRVSLTKSGLRARQQAVEALGREMATFSRSVSVENLARVMPVLEQVRQWLEAHRTAGPVKRSTSSK